MAITPLPTPPSTSDPSTFASKADALLSALPAFVTEANAQADDVNSGAASALASKNAAEAASGASVWASGATYSIGDVRWSPVNLKSYRRKTNGAGTTDPSSDATNWEQLNGFASITDGDKGDITVSDSGATWTIDNDAVTFAKMRNIATSSLLGRSTAGTGDVEELIAIPSGVTVPAASITGALNASGSAPIYACRAWVNFNGSGTVAIRASGNVSSITDNGTGDYTVNLTTSMTDANYSVVATAARGATNDDCVIRLSYNVPLTSSQARLKAASSSALTAVDTGTTCVAFFR